MNLFGAGVTPEAVFSGGVMRRLLNEVLRIAMISNWSGSAFMAASDRG